MRENQKKSRFFTTFLSVMFRRDYGMLQGVDLTKILIHDMSIGHSDLNIGVAQKLLYIHNIRIIPQQVRSKRMAESVWMIFLSRPALIAAFLTTI